MASSGRVFGGLATAVVIAAGGFYAWRNLGTAGAPPPRGSASSAPAPTPVTTAEVRRADFPVYLIGLGTVTPYDTVTVSSRVDGQIVKVDFKQGQMVNEGDTLVEIDPRPYQSAYDQAVAKKTSDEANLKNAQLNLQRYKTLSQQDFTSRQQLDTQQSTVDQLEAQIKGDQAAVDNAATQLSYTKIKAPLTGKTGFRVVDPGNIVHASATTGIVTIVKLQPISVVFTAPEEAVPQINKALGAGTVPVDALSSDGRTMLSHGHLALVNNEVDQASGAIRMKATFDNKDSVLWPGLSVSTRLLLETRKNVTVVPVDAVQRGPNGLYAYVVDAGAKARIQSLKVEQESNGLSLIEDGLKPGETVVVSGQSRLRDGALVQPSPAPSPPPEPKTAAADEPAKEP